MTQLCIAFLLRSIGAFGFSRLALAAALLFLSPAAVRAGLAHAQESGDIDIQGQWNATMAVRSGPGAGFADSCAVEIAQEGTDLSGYGSCTRAGAGACIGTVDEAASALQLVCFSPMFGTFRVEATISADRTAATGTWAADNRSGGTYEMARVVEVEMEGEGSSEMEAEIEP